MVVRDDRFWLQATRNEEINQSRLELGLTRFEIVTADKYAVLKWKPRGATIFLPIFKLIYKSTTID